MDGLNFVRWLIIFAMRLLEGTSRSEVAFIFPGTKWCGPGNISKSYYDLGPFRASDKCCREHDYCPDFLPPYSAKYGLVNDYPLPRSICDCDEKFRSCLKQVGTSVWDNATASILGYIYFTLLEARCYEKVLRRSVNGQNSTDNNAEQYRWKNLPPF